MLKRTMLGSIVACGLMAVAISGPADAAKRNTLRGKTHQGMRVRLAVMDRAVKMLRFKIDLRCADGTRLLVDESGFLKTPLKSNGSFKDTQFGSTDTVYMRGRVTGKVASGQLRVTDKLKGGIRCHSRWVKFRAH